MATAQEVRQAYIKKNRVSALSTITWSEFVAQFDATARNEILTFIKAGRTNRVGSRIMKIANAAAIAKASAEADALIADGSLSLDEMDGFL